VNSIKANLLHYTPLCILITAIRTCYQSFDKSDDLGTKDKKLIRKIIDSGHTSVLEHINYTFDIQNISRICSHQLVRHRIASYSQQSNRYTKCENFLLPSEFRSSKLKEDILSIYRKSKEVYDQLLKEGIAKETARYMLPSSTRTNIVMTINARSFRNFLNLRLDKRAQQEIRVLAKKMIHCIPEEHTILYADIIKKFGIS